MTRSPRRAAIGIVVASLLVLSGWAAASGALWYRTADLFCLIEGARLVAIGADPYDEAIWRPLIGSEFPDPFRGTGTTSCVARYASPLWTAVVMLPFGILPLEIATTLWMALSFGAVVAGIRWIWLAARGTRRLALLFAVLVVLSQPFWLLAVGGQISGVLLGLAGAGTWLLASGRPLLGGAALGALIVKPQVAGVFVPAVLARDLLARRPRALLGGALAAAALLAASIAARPDWIPAWLGEVTGRRLGYAELLPSSWGLAKDVFGTAALAPLLVALAVAAVAIVVRGRALGPVTHAALALPLSLFAMPHVWSYDMLVLALPWGTALAIADGLARARRALVIAATVAAASPLPWSLYAFGHARGQENLSAVIPVAAALVVAAAVALRPAAHGATP